MSFGQTSVTLWSGDASKGIHQSFPGIILFMNSSKRGTVKAVSPWFGLQIMPLMIKLARRGPKEFVGFLGSRQKTDNRAR
jgi:hypothetical protein